jgi:hypothetical protein
VTNISLAGSADFGEYADFYPGSSDAGTAFFGSLRFGTASHGGSGRWDLSVGWNDLATGTLGAGGADGHTPVFGRHRDFVVPATPSSWGITDFSRAYGFNTSVGVLFTPQASGNDPANTTWYCAKEGTSTYSDLAVALKAGASYPFSYVYKVGAGNLFFAYDDQFAHSGNVDLGISLTVGVPRLIMVTHTFDDVSVAVIDPFTPAVLHSSRYLYAMGFPVSPYVTAIAGNRSAAAALSFRANYAWEAPTMAGEPDCGNAIALNMKMNF